ncbi:MAG TPA: methionine adenosyltransferase [Candidatus Fimimonas merdipullorum]|uniref:S-adenosylmethionine synthase n=1 Tax=Candidatus Fimimonas merdipullorum TaxID=2840822 RepID=A0A9D1MXU7_9BACT|nr:methionine adenosyltransferase [Candidatus Fimimonas merdipullorum]
MTNKRRFFTSESVTEGHPDKMCDQISDAILDAILAQDPDARVACETVVCTGTVFVMGQITTTAIVDYASIVRDTVREIGYTRAKYGFDADSCGVIISLDKQSPDIALGVDKSGEYRTEGDVLDIYGAGDQGMMFGYACDETSEYMPMAITLAQKISKRLAEVRKQGILGYLRPDGKCQVTVEYDGDKPARVDAIVLSAQHSPDVDSQTIARDMIRFVIRDVVPLELLDEKTKYYINPTGRFEIGGPAADSGLTGRKLIVDTYGGYCAHGGGAFSGKDPTKVDRSAAYMARYICKNVVAAGLAKRIQIQVSYAIGRSKPVSVDVNTFGTGVISDGALSDAITKEFDLRPRAIINKFDLQRPIYKATASYGHFGREQFPWEQTDMAEQLKKYAAAEK